jgi:hypothetical protein
LFYVLELEKCYPLPQKKIRNKKYKTERYGEIQKEKKREKKRGRERKKRGREKKERKKKIQRAI